MSLTRNIELCGIETCVDTVLEAEKDVFTDLELKRQTWTMPNVKADADIRNSEQIHACFSRIIALSLNLELPVGSFVRAFLEQEKQLPMSAKIGLINNIKDEEKHQIAFENILKAYSVTEKDCVTANNYRKLLVKDKTHPLIKSRDMETIIFIPLQTCLRYYGSQSLERLVGYISLDEIRHLNYNWELSEILGLGFNREFEDSLVSICQWCFEPLKNITLDSEFWIESTYQMREDGESENLINIMDYGIGVAPFEISNNNY